MRKNWWKPKKPEACSKKSINLKLPTPKTPVKAVPNKTTPNNRNPHNRFKSTTTYKLPATTSSWMATRRSTCNSLTFKYKRNWRRIGSKRRLKMRSRRRRGRDSRSSRRKGPATIMSSKWFSRWRIISGRMRRIKWGRRSEGVRRRGKCFVWR